MKLTVINRDKVVVPIEGLNDEYPL